MSNTTYQSADDERVFKEILARDPESRKCFECDYPNAPWCDINHGIFVCLDCSGVHRGLGVHLSFVRSSTMDGWTSWRPEKLQQMRVGGNGKARKFFESKGVPRAPIRDRYNHVGALMYKDKLEAEANGKPFNESTWQPPGWYANTQQQQQQQQQQARTMGGAKGSPQPANSNANNNRFQGVGSNGPANQGNGGNSGGDDWLGALSSGWNSVATATTKLATTAATATVHGTQQLAGKLQESTRSAPSTDELGKKAQETAAAAASTVSSAWGALASWTTSAVSQLTEGGGAKTAGDEDGLSGLTRNLQHGEGAAAPDARFRGVEHRASPSSDPALASLARELPRGTKYESIGGSDVASPASTGARTASRQSATASPGANAGSNNGNMGSRQSSAAAFAASSPTSRSPPPAAATPPAPRPLPVAQAGGSPNLNTPPTTQEAPKKAGGLPSDWGWDEE